MPLAYAERSDPAHHVPLAPTAVADAVMGFALRGDDADSTIRLMQLHDAQDRDPTREMLAYEHFLRQQEASMAEQAAQAELLRLQKERRAEEDFFRQAEWEQEYITVR